MSFQCRQQHICLIFLLVLLVPCGKFELPYLGKAQQPQEQHYPFLSVSAVFLCVQTMVRLPVFGILKCTPTLVPAIAHRGWTDTVKESALEVDTRRKIYCHTWYSNPHQHCTWLFCPMPHLVLRPTSALHLAFLSNALPAELSPPPVDVNNTNACPTEGFKNVVCVRV